ncbi:MAG: sigma-70 family RNA polymerase sigma factor [Chloroflexi bacterium]|nr:sigma-70 family RNA polymerase sigma factor [Chloroflexota bacterium]
MTAPDLPDTQLIMGLQAGDIEALGELYERYRLPVYRTALAITRDPSAAEDILQDSFLRLYTYAHRINPSLPVAPWLYRITVNLSYTWTTKRARWWAPLEDFLDRLVGPARQAPEPEAERAEALQVIQAAIDSLPFSQRVVIVLFYLNDLSLQEIAGILECPVGTVKSRLHYGRENLRRRLVAPAPGIEAELVYEFT